MSNTKTLLFFAGISACFISKVFSQAPQIEWQNTIGGSSDDNGAAIQQTSDGGYIVGGSSYSGLSGDKTEANIEPNPVFSDYWVLKLNNTGDIEWQNTIGGTSADFLRSVTQTSDGGYLLGGTSFSGISGDKTEATVGEDYWVVKLNSSGTIEWQNTIGGSGGEELQSVQQTSDGGYILGGYSSSNISGDKTEASLGDDDYWLVKLNNTGNIEWQNTIGGNLKDWLISVQQTSDGGYILGGWSSSGISGDKTEDAYEYGDKDYWVVKVNSGGSIEWQNTIGGDHFDYLEAVQQTADGGYIIGGWSSSSISGDKTEASLGGGYDFWVVKLNSSGTIEWQNTIGGDDDDFGMDIRQTSDGGYIIGGQSSSGISGDKTEDLIGHNDYWVVKLNSNGTIQWQNTIGGNKDDFMDAIQQTADGGFIIGGHSKSGSSGDKTEDSQGGTDYWVVKLYPAVGCFHPASFATTAITSSSAKLTWDAAGGAEGYKVRYKVANSTDWTTKLANNDHKNIAGLAASTDYVWQVKTVCTIIPNFSSDWSPKQYFTTNSLRSEKEMTMETFEVYPNPFASSTTITLSIEESQNVIIELFDMAGRKLETLLDENMEAGQHAVNLDRRQLPAGMYVVKMKTLSSSITQSIIIQ